MNIENYKLVLEQIEKHPETHKQSTWHCGSQHCFFGWAQILSGKSPNDDTVRRDARLFLQVGYADANYLSAGERKLHEFKEFMEVDTAGYDRDGYDRDGYNRAGYNRDGYDRDGYDRAGYDRAGYDRDGYDRDGYDRAGYDRDDGDYDGIVLVDGVYIEKVRP